MKTSGKSRRGKVKSGVMTSTLARHLQIPFQKSPSTSASNAVASSRFQTLLDSDATEPKLQSSATSVDDVDERDLILSQDLFCTPDYITPDNQNLFLSFDSNKENVPCPESPEKLKTVKTKKRRRQDGTAVDLLSDILSEQQLTLELENDTFDVDEVNTDKTALLGIPKHQNYVSKSAVALRCRVMPPPCIKNPYTTDASEVDIDLFGNQRSKCAGLLPAMIGGDGLSRYHTDFQEIQQIGAGNFSHVFKVLKRIDGCFYAVKHSTRQLHQDADRRKALMEVQALAALGCHVNVVRYYSSWFENEKLYIHLELCDSSLSPNNFSKFFTEGEVLEVLYQIAKALKFIHERGIAHLDVKPDNIYVKDGVYKLGDFGCATLLDQSLPIEEGDARYMPQEILTENYNHLDKVDIFSLGASIYELIRGSPFPESGSQFLNLREGKLPLLPGNSLQFQNLLKVMLDPNPIHRPSAKELLENPMFDKIKRNVKA